MFKGKKISSIVYWLPWFKMADKNRERFMLNLTTYLIKEIKHFENIFMRL